MIQQCFPVSHRWLFDCANHGSFLFVKLQKSIRPSTLDTVAQLHIAVQHVQCENKQDVSTSLVVFTEQETQFAEHLWPSKTKFHLVRLVDIRCYFLKTKDETTFWKLPLLQWIRHMNICSCQVWSDWEAHLHDGNKMLAHQRITTDIFTRNPTYQHHHLPEQMHCPQHFLQTWHRTKFHVNSRRLNISAILPDVHKMFNRATENLPVMLMKGTDSLAAGRRVTAKRLLRIKCWTRVADLRHSLSVLFGNFWKTSIIFFNCQNTVSGGSDSQDDRRTTAHTWTNIVTSWSWICWSKRTDASPRKTVAIVSSDTNAKSTSARTTWPTNVSARLVKLIVRRNELFNPTSSIQQKCWGQGGYLLVEKPERICELTLSGIEVRKLGIVLKKSLKWRWQKLKRRSTLSRHKRLRGLDTITWSSLAPACLPSSSSWQGPIVQAMAEGEANFKTMTKTMVTITFLRPRWRMVMCSTRISAWRQHADQHF